jgi:uncharacterized membrane protein YtjA (UPF0391 family)
MMKPETISVRQFCFRPASPSLGISGDATGAILVASIVFVVMITLLTVELSAADQRIRLSGECG